MFCGRCWVGFDVEGKRFTGQESGGRGQVWVRVSEDTMGHKALQEMPGVQKGVVCTAQRVRGGSHKKEEGVLRRDGLLL